MKTPWNLRRLWVASLLFVLLGPGSLSALDLEAYSEFSRPGPDGSPVLADRSKGESSGDLRTKPNTIQLRTARNGYVSFFLVVKELSEARYSLSLRFEGRSKGLQTQLFKTWYHKLRATGSFVPDALIPVSNPFESKLPDPDNKVAGQTAQGFWVDVWIPPDMLPGRYEGLAVATAGRKKSHLRVQITIGTPVIPAADALTIDHNSYGTSWLASLYPKRSRPLGERFFRSDAFFNLIHAYHRIFYEHRGTFHQLGYGHAGKVGPEFAPELAGEGRQRRIANWDLFDRHYGTLLDGSAFRESRRGPQPIPFVYLPINPEWPASFLNWGEPGYEAEFVAVVGAMEKHFREKGWTRTKFEMFFNHKKRYKGFHWDGDETRFARDDVPMLEYSRLLKKAVPSGSPVQFVFRHDASWRLEQQFKTLAGAVNFWICSRAILGWLPEQLKPVQQRGDIVWIYSGAPAISSSASAVLENPLRAWMWKLDGYIHWLTVSPSEDPWFNSGGEETCLAYPGERFGIDGPIASIRLKIQRNFAQDVALLKMLEGKQSGETLREEVARRINGSRLKDWWTPRPAVADLPPEEWSNNSIEGGVEPNLHVFQDWDPQYWQAIRQYILSLAERS
jgi:Domain of unknown function (DUF4091)